MIFGAAEDIDTIELSWSRSRWQFRFQRSEHYFTNSNNFKQRDVYQYDTATPACEAWARYKAFAQCHDNADVQPGFQLQDNPNELGVWK